MINQKFGKWLVVSIGPCDSRGRIRYLCRCECGFEKIQTAYILRNLSSKQCMECRLKELRRPLDINSKFNAWTVISLAKTVNNKLHYNVLCECGTKSIVSVADLTKNKSTRCRSCYDKVRGGNTRTHGLSNSSTYKIWRRLKDRCLKETDKDYKYYGERGIGISDSWLIFENFLSDMGIRPEGLQIDRIDNNAGYYKENCRWVTPKENCNNRRKRSCKSKLE